MSGANIAGVALGILFGLLVGRLIAKIYFLEHRNRDRKTSLEKAKSVTLGYVSEKIAPLLPQFPYHYKDLVFLGKGVDYICFNGLSRGEVESIVFIEIKTGMSQLTKNELLIKKSIEQKKVSWETIRV